MDDFDTLVSRVERIELPAGTRDKHLARIGLAVLQAGGAHAAAPPPAVGGPVRRSHSVPATVLAAAAVVAILAGAWVGFAPDRPSAATPPLAGASSSATSQAPEPVTRPAKEFNLLTAPGSAALLAGLLHISAADAGAGLTRLAALAERTGGALDPANPDFQVIAHDLGVSPAALDDALTHIKAAAVAADPALGRKTGGSADRESAQPKAPGAVDTGSDLLTAPETVAKLGSLLHVSTEAAKAGLAKIAALAQQGGGKVDPTTAAFRAIATSLGSTPAGLDTALATIKASAGADNSADTKVKPANSAATPKRSKDKAPGSSTGDADLLTLPATATSLAHLLDITPAAARTGLARLAALADHSAGGLSPKSQQFRTIATDLRVTPTELNEALRTIKTGN